MPEKPTIATRKPTVAPGLSSIVAQGKVTPASRKASGTSKTSGTPKWLVTRSDGRELRRITAYLPPELYRCVAVRCAELDIAVSDGLALAVEEWLRQ